MEDNVFVLIPSWVSKITSFLKLLWDKKGLILFILTLILLLVIFLPIGTNP